ncbi:hypothetical protein HYPSUDRAFT_202734 [Hypholoma sublateritium FD-334 SS-4]|uniref:Uncharacterized protein n=1 Tax=Hypholoma sublateritium (strain FD-334 SS-4) TaxID=945553 RepID=A0A0D2NZE0_HYPSF|nr:hypothetical protein HYPSUDRAFT_202734 [Hypholoma sublateritium FD-334 SS-4]
MPAIRGTGNAEKSKRNSVIDLTIDSDDDNTAGPATNRHRADLKDDIIGLTDDEDDLPTIAEFVLQHDLRMAQRNSDRLEKENADLKAKLALAKADKESSKLEKIVASMKVLATCSICLQTMTNPSV